MTSRFSSTLAAAVVAGLVLAGSPARAETPEAVYKRGVDLRRAGKDGEALDAFREFLRLARTPRALAQVGVAEQALGMWVDAEGHLDEALQSPSDPWIVKNRGLLDRSLEQIRSRLGKLEIWGEPAGAEVLIDAKVVGTLPLAAPIWVVAGSVPVTVRAPGYLDRATVVTVAPRETARERFALQRAPQTLAAAPPATEAGDGGRGPESAAPTLVTTARPATPPGERPGTLRRGAKWGAWVAGSAALGFGVVEAMLQRSAVTAFNADCGLDASGTPTAQPDSTRTSASCSRLKSDADARYRFEVGGFVGAGILGAAGLVLWLTEPASSPADGASLSLACAPSFAGGAAPALTCAARF